MRKKTLLCITFIIFNLPAWAVSLYDDVIYRPFIADKKAYLPGDVLTVIVLETSNAQTSADLSSGKEIKTALEASYNNRSQEVSFGLRGDGRTAAKTGRNGKIKAALTVRIETVLPNGSYRVRGHQVIQINGEQQTIVLCGIVRQEDISTQNTVLSTRLGNAKITYTGDGSVSNSQPYNVIYKLLSMPALL
jgi:flagellar L-ring protein precursor FlgH